MDMNEDGSESKGFEIGVDKTRLDLSAVLQDAYDNEINVTLSSFWDSGWVADVGDKANGFRGKQVEGYDLGNVANRLALEICKLYPESEFAKKYVTGEGSSPR